MTRKLYVPQPEIETDYTRTQILEEEDISTYARNRILEKEEVSTGRLFMRTSGLFFGKEKQERGVSLYAYIRWIEDLVDNGRNPKLTEPMLNEEQLVVRSLLKGDQVETGSEHAHRELLLTGVNGLPPKVRNELLSSIYEIITGIRWDNKAIRTGLPIFPINWRNRCLYESMSGFQILSSLLFERKLGGRGNPKVEELFITWILYDALRDLEEDLSAGLILFKESDLDGFHIQLRKGEKVPPSMKSLFDFYKPQIMKSLVNNAHHIYETTLPQPYSTLLWGYFLSRALKLYNTEYPVTENTIFSGNRDI